MQKASAGISTLAGRPSSGWLAAAFVAAVVLAPFAGGAAMRAVAFFLIAMTVAWIQMAANPHTGGTVHHVILLWPWPEAVIAISLAGIFQRLGNWGGAAATAATLLVVVSALLVTNEYYARIVRNGGAVTWSAAVFPLAERLKHSGAEHVFCTDWGYLDTLTLLDRNRPVMRSAMGAADDAATVKWAAGNTANLFVGHVKEAEVDAGADERFRDAAAKIGREAEVVETIADAWGRNIFVVYRFR
jgi:hypothetical protein